MRKTLRWSILLSLLLVCVMIPVMAQSAAAEELWVGETQVDLTADSSGSGWTYDSLNKTLTLTDAAITDFYTFVRSDKTYTANIYFDGINLTVEGTGTLSGADYGFFGIGSLTFDKAALDISGGKSAVSTDEGYITIKGDSEVTASGGEAGLEIRTKGGIDVKDGTTLTATGETLALKTLSVSVYTESTVLVNEEPSASGKTEWNGTDDLGMNGNFKYVKIMPKVETYTVTVTNGTGGGTYEAGEDVTITANDAPTGKIFAGWTGADDLTFTDGDKDTSPATFTMPAENVSVTATYKDFTEYNLWVGDTQVTSENEDDILGDGTAMYKPESDTTGTLTLKQPNITSTYNDALIHSEGIDLTIKGTATLGKITDADGISVFKGNLTLSGANLTIDSEYNGFYVEGQIDIADAVLNITSEKANGIFSNAVSGSITISGDDTVVTADGKKAAIIAAGGKIDFTAPLMILEPNTWTIGKYNTTGRAVYEGEGSEKLAAHVLIRQGEYYDIYIGGVHVNSLNKDDILGDGTGSAKFDPETNILTLNNPKITAVNTVDYVTPSWASEVGFAPGTSIILSKLEQLTIKGNANLVHADAEVGIASVSKDSLIIDGNITVKGKKYGINNGMGDLICEGGTILAEGVIEGITNSNANIYVTGGTVTATATGEKGIGINAWKNITISGDDTVVTAEGGKSAIRSRAGEISIKSPLNVTEPNYGYARKAGDGTSDIYGYIDTYENRYIASRAVIQKAEYYKLAVCGVWVNSVIKDDVLGDGGSVKFDPATSTLTLDNPTITGVNKFGFITTQSEVQFNFGGDPIICSALSNLTIKGNADLSHSDADFAVVSAGSVTIDGDITMTDLSAGILAVMGDVNLAGGTIVIEGEAGIEIPIEGKGDVNISGGTVTVTATHENGSGIYARNVTITGGTVTVTATGENGNAVYAGKDIKISNPNTVVTAKGKKAAITAKNGAITIDDPLGIFEPAGGKLDDAQKNVCTYDGKIATHAVIKKFDPIADGLLYTVTWHNYDGKVLETDTNVPYGTLPAYDGAAPKRPASYTYTYAFSGWKPSVVPVTEDTTYTADFTATPILGPGGSSFPFSPFVPGGMFPGIHGMTPGGTPGTTPGSTTGGTPGTTPGGTSGSTPGTDPGSTPGGAPGETGLPFTDVTPTSPYFEDIQYVYENDLMNGMSETEFGEYLPLTRGMIVTVLHRMEGRPAVAWTGVFTDVPADMWYTDGVEWAASHGIVLGYGDGRYGPNDNVTREQLAAILHRYAKYKGYDVSVGEDTNILSYDDAFTWGDWAVPALQWACGTGVLEDVPVGMLRPTEPANRGEIAHAIHVFCEDVAK